MDSPYDSPIIIESVKFEYNSTESELFLGPNTLNWDDANSYCEDEGVHLLSIHSEEQQVAAETLCKTVSHNNSNGISYGCWIGLYVHENGDWEWSDGSSIDYGFNSSELPTTGVYPWDVQDSSSDETCINMKWNSDFKWNDLWCERSNYPICDGIPNTAAPTNGPESITTLFPSAEPTVGPTKTPSVAPSVLTEQQELVTTEFQTDKYYEGIIIGLLCLFSVVIIVSYVDARCIRGRRNDFYSVGALVTASFQIMDLISDIFFSLKMWSISTVTPDRIHTAY